MIDVRESAHYVMNHAASVEINANAVPGLAAELLPIPVPDWDCVYHYCDGTVRTAAYLFVVDSLNFCFFPVPRWQVVVNDEQLSGYFALTAVLKQALLAGRPIDDFRYLATVPAAEVKEILHGEVRIGEIPLFADRVAILHEIGTQMTARYDGRPDNLIATADNSALQLVELIVEAFPSFRDEADYNGKRVGFYKRAQILAGDLYACFSGRSYGAFHDIARLTAFADYKLPQLLRAAGVLHYSDTLAATVDNEEWIAAGSREEIEIRAATIVAIELVRDALARRGRRLLSLELDWLLWHASQHRKMAPHHRTRTTFY